MNNDTRLSSDAFSLGRGILVGLFSSSWLAFLSLALAPLYIYLLGIESYGLIGLYTAGLAIGGLLDVALSSTVSREISWKKTRPGEQIEIGPLLRSAEIIYWLIVSATVIGVLILGLVYNFHWIQSRGLSEAQVQGALALMLISLGIQIPTGLYSASLIGLNYQARSAMLLGGFGTIRGVGAALLAWSVSSDIRVFFLFHVAMAVMQLVVLREQAWSYVRLLGGRPYFSSKSLQSIRKPVGAMFCITLFGVMLNQGDKLIVAFFLPLEPLGYYSLAWAFAGGLTIISVPVYQGFSVKFSSLASIGRSIELESNLKLALKLTYALVVPLAVAISLYAESILLAWVRNADIAKAAAAVLPLIAIGIMLVACTYPILAVRFAKREFNPVLRLQFVLLILFFPLLFWLIDESGIFGAALCWMLYGTTMYASYLIVTWRQHNKKLMFELLYAFASVTAVSLFVTTFSKWFVVSLAGYDVLACFLAVIVTWMMLISGSSELRQFLFDAIKSLKLIIRKYVTE